MLKPQKIYCIISYETSCLLRRFMQFYNYDDDDDDDDDVRLDVMHPDERHLAQSKLTAAPVATTHIILFQVVAVRNAVAPSSTLLIMQ